MSVVLDNDGRAVIFNVETGQVMACSVPTALENVRLSNGAWDHGYGAEEGVSEAYPSPTEPDPVIALREEGVLDLPAAEQTEAEPVTEPVIDDLADVRTTPGDSPEKLEAIEREVDEANGKLTPEQNAALDHDGDDKAGGSTPKAGRSPEEEAERAALFKFFKDLNVKVFAGSTTDKLRAKKGEIEAATAP
jgi:hypothetical protein